MERHVQTKEICKFTTENAQSTKRVAAGSTVRHQPFAHNGSTNGVIVEMKNKNFVITIQRHVQHQPYT